MSEESVHTEMPQLRIHYEFIRGSHSQGGDLAGSIPPILPRGMLPARCMGKMYQRRCMGKLLGTGHHRSSRSHFFRSQALEKKVLFGNPAQQKPLLSRPESWRKHVPQEPGKMRPPGIRKRKHFLSPVSLQCPLQTRLSIVLLAKAEHRATGKGKTLSKTHLHYHRAGKYG